MLPLEYKLRARLGRLREIPRLVTIFFSVRLDLVSVEIMTNPAPYDVYSCSSLPT